MTSPASIPPPQPPPPQTWRTLVATKHEQTRAAIPTSWLLPATVTSTLRRPLSDHANRLLDDSEAAPWLRHSGVLTPRELEITEAYPVGELLARLASGQLTALEVTVAFCKRAAVAQQLTSCLTEIFFEEAIERARQLDETRRASGGAVVGPLHGLPISIKDSFKVVGRDATVGYAAFVGDTATTNSALVDILLRQGAVLYVKTNVPQTMMTADSENNLFGRTLNPWNTALTAGGSSGGEGALVAFRGSPLGVGTDVAGSIRIPAACCGTYGFRPTVGRVPFSGQAGGVKPGMRFVLPCAGPLANDMAALEIFCKAIIDAEPARYDCNAIDVPWRTTTRVTGKPSLRIGLLADDPRFPCLPPQKRALAEAVALIQAAGHTVVPLDPARCHVADASEVAWTMFGLDLTGLSHLTKIDEPLIKSLAFVRKSAQSLEKIYTADVVGIEERLDKLAALTVKREQIADEWRSIWATLDLDAVVGPTLQNVALPHDTFGLPPYTMMCNLLDFPACVIPFQKARPELDSEPVSMKPGQHGPNYDPQTAAGAPCSIQVFTSRMRDEECLEISRVIDNCLNKKTNTAS